MVDWRLASVVGEAVASAAPAAPAGDVAGEVGSFADRSAALVAEYTGLAGAREIPRPETVDRSAWLQTNLTSTRSILEPVAARMGAGLGPLGVPARAAGGALLAIEVGAISGYLAGRVLGQYEFPILDPAAPARLLFVGPNLAHAARGAGSDEQALVRWVALHETTHALQFSGVPWLRGHLAERVGGLLGSLDATFDPRRLLRIPESSDLRALVEVARKGDLISLVVGPGARGLLGELQSLMALVEGYAEHVMDAAGEALLPELPRLREHLNRRRGERSGLLRVVEKLIGLELKLRQYEQGKAFCDAVVAQAGIEGLNRAWSEPAALPSAEELDDPRAWLRRVA